jgi:hypothetical protein
VIRLWSFVSYVMLGPQRRFLVPPPHDVIQVGFFQLDNLRDLLTALWLSTKVACIGLAIAIALGAGRQASPSGRTVGSAPYHGEPAVLWAAAIATRLLAG